MRTLRYLGRLIREFFGFARQNKAWWIIPIVVALLLLGALIVIGTSASQFLYPAL